MVNYLSLGQWVGNVQSCCGLMRKPQDKKTELGVRVPTTSWRGLRGRVLPMEVTYRLILVTSSIFSWLGKMHKDDLVIIESMTVPIFFFFLYSIQILLILWKWIYSWTKCMYVYVCIYMCIYVHMHIMYAYKLYPVISSFYFLVG